MGNWGMGMAGEARGLGRWGSLGDRMSMIVSEGADMVWRRDCPCCARSDVPPLATGIGVCRECSLLLRRPPERVMGVDWPPVVSAGPYGGVHRALVLAAKDHHRPDAVQTLGEVLAGVLRHLISLGEFPDPRLAPLVLLPAPTRPSAARVRGGCVVARASTVAASQLGGQACSVMAASLSERSVDSTGLSRARRVGNLSSALRCDPGALARVRRLLRVPGAMACVVDDVCTTGATVTGFSLALAARGVFPSAGVVAAQA